MSATHADEYGAGAWFWIWLKIGMQSFGGGVTTLSLIRQELVERRSWISDDDFVGAWSLCQLAPGINLIAIAILFGKRNSGLTGGVSAVAGLLIPSALMTAALTAVYATARSLPQVTAALRCVMPAVAGVGLATAVQNATPPMRASRKEGPLGTGVGALLLVVPAVAVGVFHTSTLLALVFGAGCGAAWSLGFARWRLRAA